MIFNNRKNCEYLWEDFMRFLRIATAWYRAKCELFHYLDFSVIESGNLRYCTKKKNFSVKDFFSECEEICTKLSICSHLLKKYLTKNLIFEKCGGSYLKLSYRKSIKKKLQNFLKNICEKDLFVIKLLII